jgi:hypothetical protein
MFMKNMLSGVLIVFLLCSAAFAEKTIVSEFDGTDWQSWTEGKKFNFLSGFLLGSSFIIKCNEPFMSDQYKMSQIDDIRKRLSMGQSKKKKNGQGTFSKDEIILWGHYRANAVQGGLSTYAIYEITVSQLSKGMDDLYKDARNTKIKIAYAIFTVKKQISGADQAEMDNLLQGLRGE